jgi:drug/metabolite transporter (DMT)-like permease
MRANRYAGAAMARASVARAVAVIGMIVALILVAGILLVVLGANHSNELVKTVHSAGKFLAGPFDGLFKMHDHKLTTGINWGLAAVVWYALAHLISRVILRR